MSVANPILSICIPTYNRANLLQICLQSIAGQVALQAGQVELVVGDNGSTDETPAVVQVMQRHGPIRYVRHSRNLGAFGNILNLVTERAGGEYVIVVGDDDLFRPGSLKRIVDGLLNRSTFDAFYVNFRVACEPKQWPGSAWGGYDGPYSRVVNPEVEDSDLTRWITIMRPDNEMCTHIYSHILRRWIWKSYWQNRRPEEPYQSVHSTYPHTAMLVDCMANKPSRYLGNPVLTAFYGTTSWEIERPKIFLAFLPELLELALRRGMDRQQYIGCRDWVRSLMVRALKEAWGLDNNALASILSAALRRNKGSLRSIWLLLSAVRYAGLRTTARRLVSQQIRRKQRGSGERS